MSGTSVKKILSLYMSWPPTKPQIVATVIGAFIGGTLAVIPASGLDGLPAAWAVQLVSLVIGMILGAGVCLTLLPKRLKS